MPITPRKLLRDLARLATPFLLAAAFALPAPVLAAAQSACGAYFVVEGDDSLLEIAERCGVTLPALLAANPGVTDQRDLVAGNRLRIPDPAAPQPGPVEACGASYMVRSGDTLAEIAQKCGLSIPLLVAANPPLPDPLGLHEGLRIRIPNLPASAVTDRATIVVQPAPVAAAPAAGGRDAPDADAPDASDADSTSASSTSASAPLVEVRGTLERGGRCLGVRSDDGSFTAFTGEVAAELSAGEVVVLLGVPVETDACDADRTLELRILYRPRG